MISRRIDNHIPPDKGWIYNEQKLDKVPFVISCNGKEYSGTYLLLKGFRRTGCFDVKEIDCKIDNSSKQYELFKLICDAKCKLDEVTIFCGNIEFQLKNVSVCGAYGTILTLSTDFCSILYK